VKKWLPIELTNYVVGYGRDSLLAVQGSVINFTSSPVYSVTLELTVLDPPTSTTYSNMPGFFTTLPDQENPFIIFTDLSQITEYSLKVKSWSWSGSPPHALITIISKDVSGPCQYLVSGEIRNDQTHELHDLKVLVHPGFGFIGYQQAEVNEKVLAPGQTTNYSTLVWDPYVCPQLPNDFFHVWAQGVLDQNP
jgi:hypothetical protein